MNRADRTIVLTSDFPPENGGIQRYCASLADALEHLGREVTVVTSAEHRDAAAFDASLPYPVVRCAGRGVRRIVTLRAALERTLATAGSRSDVIAANWKPAGVAASLLRATRRFPLTVIAHGSEIARQSTPLRRFALHSALARVDRVVAVSSYTARLVRETSGFDADVIPVGVTPSDVTRNMAERPTILSVGRLVPRKGFDRLIEAFAWIAPQMPTATLEIVGDGPQRADLETLVRRLGIAENVRFLGALDDAGLNAAYARAWCFAMPNRREGYDVEGFGIVFLEAASAGLAALGGTGSGADDAIVDGETGYLVDGNDAGDIAQALLRLLADRDRSFAMGVAARRRAREEFSWSRVARAFAETTTIAHGAEAVRASAA
ncbi:MAG: glycosyltransferase family 4 protein [Candidatus Eremiobacteraeota bacterium]|nr:glycosyltransferase family 4 protein [Candidatus Eremiobacteraeota bacterium]